MPSPQIAPMTPVIKDTTGKNVTRKESRKNTKKDTFLKVKTFKEDKLSRLERYEELDRNHPLNKPFVGTESFRGPAFKRKYTNMICIFIFALFNVLFVAYGVTAWKDGNMGRLTHGMDFRAEICGQDKLKNKKFLYFANPAVDINVKFCVEKCPETSGQQICLYDVDPKVLTPFCYTQIRTTIAGRFCMPTEPINKKIVDEELSSFRNIIRRIIGDFGTGADIMIFGVFVSLVIASAFLRLMYDHKKIKYVVWGSIWATVAAFVLLAWFLYKEYLDTIALRCVGKIDKRNCGGFKATMFKYGAFVLLGIDVLYILLIIKIFNRINLGVGLLISAVKNSPILRQIKLLPYALSLTILVVAVFFLIGTVSGFSNGDIKIISAQNIDGNRVKTIEFSNPMRYLIVFTFFVFQWWFNVILLVGDSVNAYAISTWYFEKRRETLILPGFNLVKNILKYHMGTLIMLGLYKIIFRPARILLGFTSSTMKKPKQHLDIIRFFQACCLCCIHIYERALRYQSKHAIVQMVMWSESYRVASKRSFFLLFRHREKLNNLDSLCTFILFLTKMVCALLGGLFVYFYITVIPRSITGNPTNEIETPLAPTMLVFYIGFFFASIFQSALDITSKTLLQCYLMDFEMFVGEQRFADKGILQFMEFYKRDFKEENKFGKMQQYVKGIHVTLNPNIPVVGDEDPDDEENKRFDPKARKRNADPDAEDNDDDNPEEESEEESESESESESEEESEEESDEEERPAILQKSLFSAHLDKHAGDETAASFDFGKSFVNSSQLNVKPSARGNLSTVRSQSRFKEEHQSRIMNRGNSGIAEKEDEDDEESKQNGFHFGGWNNAPSMKSTANRPWNQMSASDVSGMSMGDTAKSGGNVKRVRNVIIDKHNVSNNSTMMKADAHNVFNKSRVADNTTMKLDYDDDDEDGGVKYRL